MPFFTSTFASHKSSPSHYPPPSTIPFSTLRFEYPFKFQKWNFFKQYCLPHGEKVESLVYLSVPYISQSPETSHHMHSPYVTTQRNLTSTLPTLLYFFQKPTFHSQHSTPTNPPLNTLFSFHYPADNKRSISKTATNSTPHNP